MGNIGVKVKTRKVREPIVAPVVEPLPEKIPVPVRRA